MSKQSHRVGPLDRARADTFIVTGIGPLDVPPLEELQRALADVAAFGKHTKVAFTPSRTSREWRYDDSDMAAHVSDIEPISIDELADLMSDIAQDPACARIRFYRAGDFLIGKISHGLSDARVMNLLQASLLTRDFRVWGHVVPERFMLTRTVLGWFGRDPRRMYRLWRLDRPSRSDTVTWVSPSELPPPRPTLRYGNIGTRAVAELRDWAAQEAPRATEATLVFAAVCRALTRAGTPVSDTAHILVDGRRYSRPATVFNGNFAIGMDFDFPHPFDPEDLSVRLQAALDAGRPLAAMSLSAIKASIGTGGPHLIPVTEKAMISFSDIGKTYGTGKMPWRNEDPRQFVCLVEPFGYRGLSVTKGAFNHEIRMSISFNAAVLDSEPIETALDSLGTNLLDVMVGSI